MLIQELRDSVLFANQEISRRGLAPQTYGNASGILRADRAEDSVVAIKPSGVPYASLTAADMVLTDLEGKVLEGDLKPSVDLETHLLLYREFPGIGGIVHTHSEFATAWAQSNRPIPCFGTTHADWFRGPVPITDSLSETEVGPDYELNTGRVIVRLFHEQQLDPADVPGVLVAGHAPFVWGKSPAAALKHAEVLELIARLAYRTVALSGPPQGIAQHLQEEHFSHMHGAGATYGQAPK